MSKKLKKITKANITHVSFVPKGANGTDFLIVKDESTTPDMQFESPIIKVDEEQRLVTGVVYAPNIVDSQGEFMEPDAIEKAAHEFMANYRNTDVKHNFITNKDVDVVESYVAKADFELDGSKITKGTWIITTKVEDDKLWEGIKKGDYKGYSMGGSGIREEIEDNGAQTSVTKDEKGLFSILKSFFLGDDIAKADTQVASRNLIVSFKARAVNEKINEIHWALRDSIRAILQAPDITNQKELVSQQIDEYKAYVLQELDTVGIKKMCEDLEEDSIIKSGKAISNANLQKINTAYESLGEILLLINQNKEPEGDEVDVEKEALQEIIKSAVQEATKGIDERLKNIEKGDSHRQQEEPITKENITEMIKDVVGETLSPFTQRIEVVEKSRGISNQMQQMEQPVEKQAKFSSVQI